MLRLTIRSGRDGRFLARVIDRDVGAFVLDYGDPSVIAEVSERAMKGGFQTWVAGRSQMAVPQDPHMILLLAHRYAEDGYLVFLDQPDAPHRTQTVEDLLPDWVDPAEFSVCDATSSELTLEPTDDTELLSADHAHQRLAAHHYRPPAALGPQGSPPPNPPMPGSELAPIPHRLPDLDEEDVPTEQIGAPRHPRKP